jgi:hypothetical protein
MTLIKERFACFCMEWDFIVIMDGFMKRRELNTEEYQKLQRIINHAYNEIMRFLF